MNFSSKQNYKKWLGYVHATGVAESTPGHQSVSIKGKSHKVKHYNGGLTTSQINLTKALESLFGGKDVFPQKFPDGGPVFPALNNKPESTATAILPRQGNYSIESSGPIISTLEEVGQMINNALPNSAKLVTNEMDPVMPTSNPTANFKINTKTIGNRIREKAYGGITQEEQTDINNQVNKVNQTGSAISAGLSAIPVFGPILGGISSLVTTGLASSKKEKLEFENRAQPLKTPENIYGNFANGGHVVNGFKQYNTGSHNTGQDQGIDQNGVPNNNAQGGYIQNQENAYSQNEQTYVMSDTLVNPETGNLFNQDAAKLNKKYNKADMIPEEKNAIDFGMARLSKLNDTMRNLKEQVLKACGGPTKKAMPFGGPIAPALLTPIVGNNIGTYSNILDIAPIINNNRLIDLQNNAVLPNVTTTPDEYPGVSKTVQEFIKPQKSPFNANTVALGLKGLGLAKSFSDALTDPEKESVIAPDYSKADKQIYSANIDYTQARQDALAAANLASNVNRSSSSGFQSFQGRQAMNFANLADQLGNIGMQENNQRSQLALQRGQYETNKALDTANRKYQNRIDNQMNKANADLADQKLFSELTQIGTTFNEYQYYKDALKNNKELAETKIKESASILGAKYENFGFDKDFMDKIANGDYDGLDFDQVIKFIATADQLKKAGK